MLLGMTPMSGGRLEVLGQPMPAAARAVRARVGVVPQLDNLDPEFTVAENLSMYAAYFGIDPVTARGRIEPLLEFAALGERREDRTETLSGGMKRRLTIARALVNEPELVVLDEPTTGLDPQARHLIWHRLSELRARGTTLLLTTHYMEEAERLCDEVLIMDGGRILDQGSPRELVRRHVEPEVMELRGTSASLAGELAGLCRIEHLGTSAYCYTNEAGSLIERLQSVDPKAVFLHRPAGLEDVFLRLTGRDLRD